MDDILVCALDDSYLQDTIRHLNLTQHGLQVAPEKNQKIPPWKYLGWILTEQNVKPQQLPLKPDVRTLNDLQEFLGAVNWIRPMLGLAPHQLKHLFARLKEDPDFPTNVICRSCLRIRYN